MSSVVSVVLCDLDMFAPGLFLVSGSECLCSVALSKL